MWQQQWQQQQLSSICSFFDSFSECHGARKCAENDAKWCIRVYRPKILSPAARLRAPAAGWEPFDLRPLTRAHMVPLSVAVRDPTVGQDCIAETSENDRERKMVSVARRQTT